MNILVDCIAVIIQGYLIATMVCDFLPVTEPKRRSFWLAFAQMWMSYIVVNFVFNVTPAHRIISGTLTFVVFGVFFYRGNLLLKIGLSVLQYMFLLMIDLAIQFLLFVDFVAVIKVLPPFEMNMMGRLLGTSILFLICVVLEFIRNRHKSGIMKIITGLGVVMAVMQLQILDTLSKANGEGMIRSRVGMSILFSFVLMGGYIVVMELFRAKIRQQEKENLLEQIQSETTYQCEYYCNALKQGEELRNIRHDMRNQIQAVQFLLNSKRKEDKKRVALILSEMKQRIEQ
jgi:hypothetical protein